MRFNRYSTIFLLLSTLSFHSGIRAEAADYVQRLGAKGWIYHTFNKKMPSIDKRQKPKSIDYDYTYVEQPDSVNMLCTIDLTDSYRPYKVEICTPDTVMRFTPEIIYADPTKSGYECRLRIPMSFNDWKAMYDTTVPFIIRFKMANGDSHISYSFGFNGKKWESDRLKITRLQQAIEFSKRK